jgi:iron complex outermembrane recepter protein
MKSTTMHRTVLALMATLALVAKQTNAQATKSDTTTQPTTRAAGDTGPASPEDEPIVLSPFQVTTEKDKGYKATNATSGTRLNTAIKDAPLPIEVITNEFMRDIGATSLREALQYSSGILLESQNDALNDPQQTQDREPGGGGANNPQGVTGRNTSTGTKMRGYTVEQTLRNGFRRQFSTDWINIERVEVVRGPEALLYGVGSFGGVINYIPKRPEHKEKYYGQLTIGSQDYKRVEMDATGPMGDGPWKPAYRVTGAWQENGDHTEWFKNRQFFVSPVFSFRPLKNMLVVIDNEFGSSRQDGNGFQSIRLSSPGSGAHQRNATFWPGSDRADLRTFRWSGPDVYLDTDYRNHVVDIEYKLAEDLYLKAGWSLNHVERDSREIANTALADNMFIASDPLAYNTAGVFRANALNAQIPNQSLADMFNLLNSSTIPANTVRTSTFRYTWEKRKQEEDRNQVRVEATYGFEAWGKHQLLVGTQYQRREETLDINGFARTYSNFNPSLQQQFAFRNPYDFGPIRYGFQGDGMRDPAMKALRHDTRLNWDLGYYAAYQGKFFNDRVTIIGGYRYDRNDGRATDSYLDSGQFDKRDRSLYSADAPNKWSPQIGASFAITRNISIFGLYSTGLIPNQDQPDGNGALNPTTAKNYEAGIKLDVLDGRVSGTVSAYKIERENTPRNVWWAPAPYKAASDPVNPNLPRAAYWSFMGPEALWYAINKTPNGLAIAKEIFPSGWHPMMDRYAATPALASNPNQPNQSSAAWGWWGESIYAPANMWNGSTGTLQFQANQNTFNPDVPADVYWPLVNLDNPQHQQFAINALESMGLMQPGSQFGWAGSFYDQRNGQRLRYGNGTIGVRNIPHYTSASVPINDEANGFDAQIILTPTDNWQITLNYAYVKRELTTQYYQYVKTPYYLPVAQYYYPVFGWGTIDARPASQAFADTRDTSTFRVPLPEYGQSLDDTPKHQASFWTRYTFTNDLLRGFGVGFGGRYEGRRQYYSGFAPDGTGIAVTINGERRFVQFWTKERYTFDAMVDYNTKVNGKYDLRLAMNVSNLLDDQGRYGFIFARGMQTRFSASIRF